MPSLTDHHSGEFFKLLYIGDSGTGKTGSLASLVKAGYDLRILDMDNGLDSLVAILRAEYPEGLAKVDFETRRDTYKTTAQGPIPVTATAYVEAMRLLDKWSDGSVPSEWGPKTVFVLDSFTMLGNAAMNWATKQNPGAKDRRQIYGAAQDSLKVVLSMLTSEAMKTNVILISHVKYDETVDDKGNVTSRKGFPNAVGSAMGPLIASYFNTLIIAETVGSGGSARRLIRTVTNGVIDAKCPVPIDKGTVDLKDGLAKIVATLKGKPNA